MTNQVFYTLSDNSFRVRGAPWFLSGFADRRVVSRCPACKHEVTEPKETIRLDPKPENGTFWPDAIGCSAGFLGLYVSARVKIGLDDEQVKYGRAFPAQVMTPFPKKIREHPPTYYHLTGVLGVQVDFEASGYSVRSICDQCKHVEKRPGTPSLKFQFVDGTWTGSDIFYTDLSRAAMFCTGRILELARKYKWTNFQFIPIAEGQNLDFKAIEYLK
jgi:hypothetical protein